MRKKSVGTRWTPFYVNGDNVVYIDSFIVEYITKKNLIIHAKIEANDSIMCEYFCIGFSDFMLKGKILLDYNNLFSSIECEINDKITRIFSVT